jgi:hypothetical protein
MNRRTHCPHRSLALVVAAALLVVTGAAAHPAHDGRGPDRGPGHAGASCDPAVVARFDAVDDAMRQLERDSDKVHRGRRGFSKIENDLAALRASLQEARIDACRAARRDDTVVVVAPPPPAHTGPVVMDAASERALVNAVRSESFDDSRLSVIALATRDVCVTSAQAKELVGELSFSRPRVEAVKLLAPRIVDRELGFTLLEAMTFESDKRDAKEILTSAATARECRLEPRRL